MPSFSKKSLERLETCNHLLQLVCNLAIKETDFVVLCGHRTTEEQQELYKQGRTKKGRIVTNIDGIKKKSKHNALPSRAVDLAPFPIDWDNEQRFIDLSSIILRVAKEKNIPIAWGGSWKMKDLPHYELSI